MRNIEKMVGKLKEAGYHESMDVAVTSSEKLAKILDIDVAGAKEMITAARRSNDIGKYVNEETIEEFITNLKSDIELTVIKLNDGSILDLRNPSIILRCGEIIKLHSYDKKGDECILCSRRHGLENHHISHKYDLAVTLCQDQHRMVHRNKKHPLYPIDGNPKLKVELTEKNSDKLKKYCIKNNLGSPARFVNNILQKIFRKLEESQTKIYG